MKKLFYFFSLIILYSCSSYRYVAIDILMPPDYQSSNPIDSIILINRASEPSHNTILINTQNDSKQTHYSNNDLEKDSVTIYTLYNTFNYLCESQLYSSISIKNNISSTAAFKKYNTDAVLTLISLQYKGTLDFIYEDEDIGKLKITTASQWLFYDKPNSYTPYHFTINDTLYWDKTISQLDNCIIEAVWKNGQLAAEHISPNWQKTDRIYYSGLGYFYNEIDEAIRQNDWEKAAQNWMMLYNNETKISLQKGRMAFNMALFFEIRNDFDTSLMWLETAGDIFSNNNADKELKLCRTYNNCLQLRLQNKPVLDAIYAK